MASTSSQPEVIKLIVKAPNQLIEDQNVDCEVSWTVLHLKEHLSQVYPSKPVISDQKLIYSGQLLTDGLLLKDVLRHQYEGQKAHSLHLVCTPPRSPIVKGTAVSNSTTSQASATTSRQPEEVRSANPRTSSAESTTTSEPAVPPASSSSTNQSQSAWSWVQATQQQFLSAASSSPSSQHPVMYPPSSFAQAYDPTSLAQMHQVYSQYMAQYLSHLQQAGVSAEVLGSMQAQAVQQGWNAHPGMPQTPRPAAVPAAPGPAVPAAPLAQNNLAAAPQMMAADEDEVRLGRQRDWLDWFYILSRLLVLFSIVYFYSSLKRFVFVSALGLILYLYHLGYFRLQQVPDPDNNNGPAAAEQPPPAPAPRQENDEPAPLAPLAPPTPGQDGLRQRRAPVEDNNGDPAPPEDPQPQLLPQDDPPAAPLDVPNLFLLTSNFIITFFTSLIPDRPNVA